MGTVLIVSFFIFLLLGVPVAIVLGSSSAAALWLGSTIPLTVIPQRMFTAADSFPLLAIPLFMLAGALMDTGGISKRLINFANKLVGGFTGGLALVSIVSCMLFAAISGSGPATVAAIGGIMIPSMVKEGYPPEFAAATMATAGSIGIIIPPSIPMVTYGTLSGASVGKLFTAGILPGMLMGLFLMATSWIICKKQGFGKSTTRFSLREFFVATKDALWALVMPIIILGGIYGGVFTPTEAAGIAVIFGFVIGFFIYKEIKITDLPRIFTKSASTTAMIMLIISTAQVFGWIMTSQRIPDKIALFLLEITTNKFTALLMINFVLLIAGCFMETNAALILLVPIFLPMMPALGISSVHFGIIAVMNLAIGMATPPLGVNLFVASGIQKIKLEDITRAVLPFIFSSILALLIITFVPVLF